MGKETPRLEKLLFVAAIALFLVVQLWMSWFLWQRQGNIPPGFDDSYFYISKIQFISEYGSLIPDLPGLSQKQTLDTSLRSATYNVMLGGTARMLGVSAETIYYWSFFAGKVVLLLALLFFFTRLGLSQLEQTASLVVLAPFSGEAAIHGFFWVVPSFWLFILFLVISALFVKPPRHRKLAWPLGLVMAALFFFLHPLALWATLLLLSFLFLATIFSKRRKAFLAERLSFVTGFTVGIILAEVFIILLPIVLHERQTLQSIVVQASDVLEDVSLATIPQLDSPLLQYIFERLPGLWIMWRAYLRFILFPPAAILLGWTLWWLWQKGRMSVALLSIATILGMLPLAIHPFGYRTILFVWPITLMILGIGIVQAPGWLAERYPWLRPIRVLASIFGVALLAGALLFHSVVFVRAYRSTDDVSWDTGCAQYLLEVADDQDIIEYSDKYSMSAFLAHGLLERRRSVVQEYVMEWQQNPNFSGQYFYVESPRSVVTRSDVEQMLGEELTLLRQCGFFTLHTLEKHAP